MHELISNKNDDALNKKTSYETSAWKRINMEAVNLIKKNWWEFIINSQREEELFRLLYWTVNLKTNNKFFR